MLDFIHHIMACGIFGSRIYLLRENFCHHGRHHICNITKPLAVYRFLYMVLYHLLPGAQHHVININAHTLGSARHSGLTTTCHINDFVSLRFFKKLIRFLECSWNHEYFGSIAK